LFEIIALRSGQTLIHFIQARPFEKGKPPLATLDYLVLVHAPS
jgi:hypothetical protein